MGVVIYGGRDYCPAMKFTDPLQHGRLIKRYKRFMADIERDDGDVVTAHCANSGSMISVNEPGSEVWISPAKNPDRKLKFTWELIRIKDAMVGINTSHPNGIVAEAIHNGEIPELTGYENLRREVKYGGNSRIDILLEDSEKPDCYVEVKNVTLKRDLSADAPCEFPDGVTARGTKHLGELEQMVKDGKRAVMFYLVQRDDAQTFALADDIDPAYSEAFHRVRNNGVEMVCYGCRLTPEEIVIDRKVEIVI